MNNPRTSTQQLAGETAKIAIVAALYVAVTLILAPISFGAFQLRFSEMFNFLGLYNRRYFIGITLGVAIANLFSPQGIIDVVFGSLSTLLVLIINDYLTRNLSSMVKKMVVTTIVFALSMCTVAGQLYVMYQTPFFFNWLTIGIGELLSMTVGGIIIYFVGQRIDLSL